MYHPPCMEITAVQLFIYLMEYVSFCVINRKNMNSIHRIIFMEQLKRGKE